MDNKIIRNNLFKIKNDLDFIIKILNKYNLRFNYHSVININKITDWKNNIEYNCPNKTIILKDISDIKKGIGIIYNITSNNILIIGTVGIGYLNSKRTTNNYYKNEYLLINLNEINSLEDIYLKIIKILLSNYIIKYKSDNLINKEILQDIIDEVKSIPFNIIKI